MALNSARNVAVADWLSRTHVKKLSWFFTCGDTIFLSGGNSYTGLQSMQVTLLLYLKSGEVYNNIKGNLIIFILLTNGQVPWQPSQKQFIICDDEN